MTKSNLKDMAVDALVTHFAELALAQDQAERIDDIRKVNRLFDALEEVEAELKQRNGDMRTSLLILYDHPNTQVRLKTAKATLAVAPQKARAMLESIRTSGHDPQALEAGMTIRAIDSGTFKPT